ncbi:MAG: class I SAM-dependent methyltransferase [Alphaproteobacteria bacterium]|nr:class I SAM-dependent methyltransferase [Alphaproteobacteria bacterium]
MLKFFNCARTILPLSRKKQSIRNLILWGAFALTIHSVHAMNTEDKERDTYVLQTGKKGAERLTEQNEFLKPFSIQHLKNAGLSKGQIVWDIGCGNGAMTEYLAEMVGETGHVYAMDKSKEQLDIARKNFESKGFKNVTFIQGDAQSLENLSIPSADLVYIRFLLLHVPKPEEIIKGVKKLLKPGGVVAAQEPVMSSAIYNDLPEYKETLTVVSTKLGFDFDIGKKLPTLYQDAGFNCTVEEHLPVPTPRQAKGVNLKGLNELKAKGFFKVAIQLGHLKQEQLDEWERTINSWSDTEEGDTAPYYTSPINVYVVAK